MGGRQKGTPNKATQTARDLVDRLGCDPLEILFHFANNNWAALGYAAPTEERATKDGIVDVPIITTEMRLRAAMAAADYVHPRRKPMEAPSAGEGNSLEDAVIELNWADENPI